MYKVFIVDDEPIILSGISHLVNWPRLDCQIAGSFRNGREALNAIEHSGADIVITDIKMPVMDGLELVRACSEKYPQIAQPLGMRVLPSLRSSATLSVI